MKLGDILKGIEILECRADTELEISGICHDSRLIRPGELFVAVSGFSVDGHRYIGKAVCGGAAAVLCEKAPEQNIPYVRVRNARQALAAAGANWYSHPADKMTMIGVTGTNGKTTITYLLKTVLEKACGAKVGLIGTIQNMIADEVLPTERTTPESLELQALLARMYQEGCTHVLMEVSSHALVLHRADEIRFQVGVYTNLSEDHLDFHKDMEEYCEAKAMLFSRCENSVLNMDDGRCARMERAAAGRILRYSAKNEQAELFAANVRLHSDRIEMDAKTQAQSAAVRLGIPGVFSVYNALGALGAALALGVSLPDAARALSQARGVKGRVEVVPTPGKAYTVLIDYSHTPDSLENVLKMVRGFCRGRVIAVFGCGGDRDRLKRPIMGKIASELADLSVVTSDNPRTEKPEDILTDITAGMQEAKNAYTVIENRRQAIGWAMEHAEKDDVIVLCGKGHETYQEINHVKYPMDEREIVAEYLEKKP